MLTRLLLLASVLAALVAPAAAGAGNPGRYRSVSAEHLRELVLSGRPVLLRHVEVRGNLSLPSAVDQPLVVRDSRFAGRLLAAHTRFQKLVDLTDTEVDGGFIFSGARFGGPFLMRGERARLAGGSFDFAVFEESAVFAGATFGRPASFVGAQFHGPSRFPDAHFKQRADFFLAGFDRVADFTGICFDRGVRFTRAEFGSAADFTSMTVAGGAVFDEARFSGRADLIGGTFSLDRATASASFANTDFAAGATFLMSTFDGPVTFAGSRAAGDMVFEDVIFGPGLDFSSVRLLGAASFESAQFAGDVTFDQAVIGLLDLEGAIFASRQAAITLPSKRVPRSGHIAALRLDRDDVRRIVRPGQEQRAAWRDALSLVERTARAADDLETANDARVDRWTLARRERMALWRALDWFFLFAIGGYLARWWHQAVGIGFVLVAGVGARWWTKRGGRRGLRAQLTGFLTDLKESLSSLMRLATPQAGGWAWTEYLAFKLFAVLFALNLGNAWPPARELLEGLF